MAEKKKAEAKNLRPEVAAKFTVLPGIGIGEMSFRGQTIHLDQITLAEAEELVKNKFKALVPKAATNAEKKS